MTFGILMTADAVGGVWSYALALTRALGPHGVHVTLAVMGPPPSEEQRAAAAALPNLGLHSRACRLEWMDEPWDDVAAAGAWLLDLARQVRPDLVHLNGYAHAALPWPAPVLVVAHSCVLSWWQAVKGEPAPRRYDRYRDAVAAGLAAADSVVAPTKAMLDALAAHYGAPAHGTVIPNGIASGDFAVGSKERLVIAAGRFWDEAKNLAALDRAAAALDWPVLVAGDRRHPNGAHADAAHAETLGFIAPGELRALLARAAIYCAPARYEPFGLSVLEAAASGCALVLGDIASLREIWGDAALFAPPDDPAPALRDLIAAPGRRAALAARARWRAMRYPIERTALAYLDLYRALTGAELRKSA